jgi:hypothetical protein
MKMKTLEWLEVVALDRGPRILIFWICNELQNLGGQFGSLHSRRVYFKAWWESRCFLYSSCNCQWNCHEASVLGPTWIASPWFFVSQLMRIMFYIYLCHYGTFFHCITYVNVPKRVNSVFFKFDLFICAFIRLSFSWDCFCSISLCQGLKFF